MSVTTRHKRRAAALLGTVLLLVPLACGGDDEVPVVEGVIDRETFIETYVDLRSEAVANRDFALSADRRDEILARHGVDEESLLAFVDAYSAELDFMNELWAEVESRIEALPPVPDSARRPGG
jgi:hypothetical protein